MSGSGFAEDRTGYVTRDAERIVGSYHRIGHFGPAYEVLRLLNDKEALIVLLETGEEVEYPIEDILTDPDPDDEPPASP